MERRRRWETERARRQRHQRRQRRRNDPVRRARRRRLALAASGLVVVAVIALAVVALWPEKKLNLSTGPIRDGSELVREEGSSLKFSKPLKSYGIVYRIDDFAGDEHRVATDVVSVRRPFESRVESKSGPPPGKKGNATTIGAFGIFASAGEGGGKPLVVQGTPTLASGDVWFDDVLEELVEKGLIERRERRRVLGRECQVYRAGEPIGGGRLIKPKEEEWSDECIDDRGLILEELWVLDGKPLRRKLAVEVDANPKLPDKLFAADAEPIPLDQGGGSVRPLAPTNRPRSTYWELKKPPDGFTHRGRYLVATGRPGQSVPGMPAIPIITFVDVYESGPRLILIEQGDVGDRESEFENPPNATRVRLGKLGTGDLSVGVLGNTIRARPDKVQFVKVVGTVAPDELVRIMAALQPQKGGEDIKPLEGEL